MFRLFIFVLFLCPLLLSAQRFPSYLSVEAGGNGILGSVNFGKPVIIHPNYRVNFQWGIGLSSKKTAAKNPFNFPVQLVAQIGREHYFFEAGMGSSLIFASTMHKSENDKTSNEWYISPVLGFRHESKKWFWRAYTCPLFHVSEKNIYDDFASGFIKLGFGFGLIL